MISDSTLHDKCLHLVKEIGDIDADDLSFEIKISCQELSQRCVQFTH